MKTIGGYFELELHDGKEYHDNAIKLNSGRNSLMFIVGKRSYKKVYLPYYTCEAALEPIKKLDIRYDFYHIDSNLEPIFDFRQLHEDEAFLYTNYFGLKDRFIDGLVTYDCNVIIDNCQAFFSQPSSLSDSFYSPRKFFGVPDGGILYMAGVCAESRAQDFSHQRCAHLLKRIDLSPEEAYADFLANEEKISEFDLRKTSKLTQKILASVNYEQVSKKRNENFNYLHESLKVVNEINVEKFYDFSGAPMVYPLLIQKENLRSMLIERKIYVATYWPNVFDWVNEDSFECYLAKYLVPLPIDQRYDKADMKYIAELTKRLIC